MRLIYIAGPYRGETPAHIQRNINQAWECGARLIKQIGLLGFFPVIPHLNTMHMDGLQSDEYFLDGTMELMLKCDGVLLMDNWGWSKGSINERNKAKRSGIPAFFSIPKIPEYDWKDSIHENTARIPSQNKRHPQR